MSEQQIKSGFILINKPASWTSFDVVAYLRKVTGIKKIGHAGTLDPLATGLLIIAIGSTATKKINTYVKLDKIYTAKIKLGETSDSYDAEGKIIINNIVTEPTQKEIEQLLIEMTGPQQQIPPMFSAKKINGQRLYQLARQGLTIERQPSAIIIYQLELLTYQYPWLNLKIHCSSGTYIRSLIQDIGQKLSCGAVLYQLNREQIGDFQLTKARAPQELNSDNWSNYLQN